MHAFILKAARRLLRRSSDSLEIDGLWVGADTPESLSRIEDALRLIREHDPRRYARLTKDLENVWAHVLPGSLGQFQHLDWTCELDERFVADASVERIAATIVHEATHARLERRGVRYEADVRHRIETICFRREQAFARRLPEPDALADELQAYLDLPAEFWSDKEMYRAHTRGSIAALRHLNAPRWLIGFVLRTHRARRRRLRRAAVA